MYTYIHIYVYVYVYVYKHIYMYDTPVCIYMYTYMYIYIGTRDDPPAPMIHVKIYKGWPPRDAPSKMVQLWYKTFQPDQSGLVEMKNPTRLSNKTSNA